MIRRSDSLGLRSLCELVASGGDGFLSIREGHRHRNILELLCGLVHVHGQEALNPLQTFIEREALASLHAATRFIDTLLHPGQT